MSPPLLKTENTEIPEDIDITKNSDLFINIVP
jgi:hypothetical protein